MTYSNPLNYGQQQYPMQYEGMQYRKPSAIPLAAGGAIAGGIAGASFGAYKGYSLDSYISKNGNVVDSFARNIYEQHINNSTDEIKEIYNQGLDILNKIKSVKNTDELKQLLETNRKAADTICKDLNQNLDDYLKNITADNLDANKKSIKDKLNIVNNARYQEMKNQIQACWDKDKKKFIKSDTVSDDIFQIIKKTTSKFNWKKMFKFAAIGSAITAIVTFIAGKLLLK